jgi:hypothetical protein
MNPQRQTIRGVDGDVTSGVAGRRSAEHPSQESSESVVDAKPVALACKEFSSPPASLPVPFILSQPGEDKLDVDFSSVSGDFASQCAQSPNPAMKPLAGLGAVLWDGLDSCALSRRAAGAVWRGRLTERGGGGTVPRWFLWISNAA